MHEAERITLARLPSGVELETTVHTYGGGDGPTLYVQAAQHGREINGSEVLRRLHGELLAREDDLTGTVVAVPVADPITFDRVSYTAPEALDSVNANMNRCWPGDEDGTLHERMAATLWEYAGDADAIVDLHTGGKEMLSHTVYLQGDAECRALAEAFGHDLLLAEAAGEDADAEWQDRDFGGKLRVAATQEGIPTITPELAHNTELVEDAIDAGVAGMLDTLRHLDMLPGEAAPTSATIARNHLGRVKAEDSGLFHVDGDVELGDYVEPGDHVGVVYDPTSYDVLQEVTVDREGIVYSLEQEATVTAGSTLVGVALLLEE
ncbi:succinylglutamate desuccinylase/aspartoacylase family protein [Halolamina sp. CBA1230]|uniref:succinylglutamate desuccinylase/aspartoacylase family protein n=1 Tax=Halolamina sp. CBA1230 TaxID=1853690 RepID=UPI0009A1EF96|nr:succinylglutamate desuccinylase/aspartoacylase family protein [Halolamina sp. CBA1230]QKY20120.1 succinylglutamate desuccinylase/aspartoacylase family protein [Halolamina sp. CBA1230]